MNYKVLINAAKDLNETFGLQPPIVYRGVTEDFLLEQLKEAASSITEDTMDDDERDLQKGTVETLKKLKMWPKVKKSKDEDEEDTPDYDDDIEIEGVPDGIEELDEIYEEDYEGGFSDDTHSPDEEKEEDVAKALNPEKEKEYAEPAIMTKPEMIIVSEVEDDVENISQDEYDEDVETRLRIIKKMQLAMDRPSTVDQLKALKRIVRRYPAFYEVRPALLSRIKSTKLLSEMQAVLDIKPSRRYKRKPKQRKRRRPRKFKYSRMDAICEALQQRPLTIEEWVDKTDICMMQHGLMENPAESRHLIRYVQKMERYFDFPIKMPQI